MSLLGTLLLPCLALTRDLANAAAAFSIHSPHGGTSLHPADPVEPSCPPLKETGDGHGRAASNDAHSDASACAGNGPAPVVDCSPPPEQVPENIAPAVQQQQQPTAGAVKAGTGLSRPSLVTALEFMSPYPLVMATSTGGAVVVWRTSDCVCVQVSRNPPNVHYNKHTSSDVVCASCGEHNFSTWIW